MKLGIVFIGLLINIGCIAQTSGVIKNRYMALGGGIFTINTTQSKDFPNFLSPTLFVSGEIEFDTEKYKISTGLTFGLKFPRKSYYSKVNGTLVTKYPGLSLLIDDATSIKTRFLLEVPLGITFDRSYLSNLTFGYLFRIWNPKSPADMLSFRGELAIFLSLLHNDLSKKLNVGLTYSHGITPIYSTIRINSTSGSKEFSKLFSQFITCHIILNRSRVSPN